MKNINMRHIISIEILSAISIFIWRVAKVRYDVGVYDTLINTNFAGALLLTFITSALLIYSAFKRFDRTVIILSLISYLTLGFLAPYIANFPNYFHRDVYLHLPYSLVIARTGHIPLYADRWDISSFPGAFVFYSILMEITGISSANVIGILMAVNYVVMLVIFIAFLASFFTKAWHINEYYVIMIVVQLLPFITRYAPRPEFPFRFHLAFLQSLLYLALFIDLARKFDMKLNTIICLALIYTSIVFTHPFFPLFIFIASILYIISYTLTHLNVANNRVRLTTTLSLISVVIIFLIHVLYVVAVPLLRQTYSLIFKSEYIPKFLESSYPINIASPNILIQLLATTIRFLWRVTIFMITLYTLMLILLTFAQKRMPVLGINLGVAGIAINIPLIVSFLWWERSFIFIGMALIVAECEALYILFEKGLIKRLFVILSRILLIITLLSITVSALITWEGPRFLNEWHGVENEVFLRFIAYKISSPSIHLGVYSNIEFTYYKILSNVAVSSRGAFDPLNHVFYYDLCNAPYLYAVSQKDPDYRFLDIRELIICRSMVWNSGTSYMFR